MDLIYRWRLLLVQVVKLYCIQSNLVRSNVVEGNLEFRGLWSQEGMSRRCFGGKIDLVIRRR